MATPRGKAAANGRPVRARRRTQPVEVIQVDRATLELALTLAEGDTGRLQANRDGSVTVLNHPKGRR